MPGAAVAVRPRRDGAALAVGYAVLAAVAAAIGGWGLSDRAARPAASSAVVWLTWFLLALWLVAAAVSAWAARRGRLAPWLPLATGLAILWLVTCVVVAASSSTAIGFYVLPAVALGGVVASTFALVVRVARAARRG